ncbi:MAG: hypothetical protein ABI690_32930 [Chloroflexota bacterium]
MNFKSSKRSIIGFWLRLSSVVTALSFLLMCLSQFVGHGIGTQAISYTTLFDSPLGHGIILLDINRNLAAKFVKNKMIGLMAWSPDGTRIVFLGNFDPDTLYLMDVFGQQERVLLSLKSHDFVVHSIDWSPDGQYIVLDNLNNGTLEIYVIDLDAPNFDHKLIAYPNAKTLAAQPVWSPDGQKIVFSSGDGAICIINPDGSGLRCLTDSTGRNITPAWSPDGQQIIYAADENLSGVYQLYRIGLDGSSRKPFSTTAVHGANPQWSPSGQYILFTGTITSTINGFIYEPLMMNTDGSDIHPIVVRGINEQWQP